MRNFYLTMINLILLGMIAMPSGAGAIWPPEKGRFSADFWSRVNGDSTLIRYGNPGWVKKMRLRRQARWNQARSQPTLQALQVDDFYLPVLLGGYSNQKISYSVENYQAHLFDDNPNGTMIGYYKQVSYGQLNIIGTVLGSYTAGHTASFYASDNDGVNYYFPQNAEGFVTDIVDQADKDVDFSGLDNDGPDGVPNSGDDDGYVD